MDSYLNKDFYTHILLYGRSFDSIKLQRICSSMEFSHSDISFLMNFAFVVLYFSMKLWFQIFCRTFYLDKNFNQSSLCTKFQHFGM